MARDSYGWLVAICLFVVLAVVGGGCSGSTTSAPANFPTKQVTCIVPGTPGSAGDVLMRAVAKVLEKDWGVPVVAVNKPGGAGAVGLTAFLEEPADGYTYVNYNGGDSVSLITGALGRLTSPDQLRVLARLQADYFAIAVRSDSPWKTMADLVSHLKANPGTVSVGGLGATTGHTLSAVIFAKRAGIEWKWVAYNGQADADKAMLGNEIQTRYGTMVSLGPFAKSGDFRLLGVASPDRLPQWQDLPTFKQSGVDHASVHWRGIAVRPEVPSAVPEAYYTALRKAVKDPELVAFAEREGSIILDDIGPGAHSFFLQEYDGYKKALADMK